MYSIVLALVEGFNMPVVKTALANLVVELAPVSYSEVLSPPARPVDPEKVTVPVLLLVMTIPLLIVWVVAPNVILLDPENALVAVNVDVALAPALNVVPLWAMLPAKLVTCVPVERSKVPLVLTVISPVKV